MIYEHVLKYIRHVFDIATYTLCRYSYGIPDIGLFFVLLFWVQKSVEDKITLSWKITLYTS